MQFGFNAPTAGPMSATDQLVKLVVEGEAMGFDYERLRAQLGAGEVVRRVLDAHFSRSWPLAKSGRVDALLWSETVYPTTYGNPKSEAGAEFDGEIAEFVRAAAVPLVFGSYDTDAAGEYNAAAFVERMNEKAIELGLVPPGRGERSSPWPP